AGGGGGVGVPGGIFLPLPRGLLLRPGGPLLSRRWWFAAVAAVLGLLLRLYSDAVNPITPDFDLGDVGVLLTVASAVAGLAALALRWRRGRAVLRQQVKWMAAAAVVVVLAF